MHPFSNFQGITPGGLTILAAGIFLTLLWARALLTCCAIRLKSPAQLLCGYWISCAGTVVLTVLIAGKTGCLNAGGMLAIQGVGLALLLACCRHTLRPFDLVQELAHDLRRILPQLGLHNERRTPKHVIHFALKLLLGLVGLLLLVVALGNPVLNHDTHIYRLPRIGMWLQQNHVGHFETSKALMNFTGRSAESLILWLAAPFASGFPLVHLVNWTSGMVVLAATYELGRRCGLTRLTRLLSLYVVLGTPNLLVQITTSQTDLIAAAFTTSGLVLVHEALALRKTGVFVLAGAAFGLAVGTKQTVLVWGPGFAILALLWCRHHGFPWQRLLRPSLPALLAATIFCLPLFAENRKHYGHWLVPGPFLQNFPSLVEGEQIRPMFYPWVYLWHLSWPAVQSPLLLLPAECLHRLSAEALERHTVHGLGRGVPRLVDEIRPWMANGRYHEDIAPPSLVVMGSLVAGLFLIPLFRLCRKIPDTRSSRHALFLLGGATTFAACATYFGWEIYSWRFWVVPTPVITLAVVSLPAAWGRRGRNRLPIWAAALFIIHLPIILTGIWRHGNSGLLTLLEPRKAQNQSFAKDMARMRNALDARPRRILADPGRIWNTILFRGARTHVCGFLPDSFKPDFAGAESSGWDTFLYPPPMPPDPAQFFLLPFHDLNGQPMPAARRLAPGELPAPVERWREGYYADGWIAPTAVLELKHRPNPVWEGAFRHHLHVPVRLRITGKTGTHTFWIPPSTWTTHTVPVRTEDELHFDVDPVLPPRKEDPRSLGIRIRTVPNPDLDRF